MSTPALLVVAGPNGSGKTTLTDGLRKRGYDFGEYINPDDIARELSGPYDFRVRQAQLIADERRDACVAERRNFSFETVMSHPSKIELMKRAREADFDVLLFFVCTESPRINVARVNQRVQLGGHDVPPDKIRTRYERTLSLLAPALRYAHRTKLFDNSSISNPMQRVLELRTGEAGDPVITWRSDDLPNWVVRALSPLF